MITKQLITVGQKLWKGKMLEHQLEWINWSTQAQSQEKDRLSEKILVVWKLSLRFLSTQKSNLPGFPKSTKAVRYFSSLLPAKRDGEP